MSALAGIRVLDLTRLLPGAVCSMMLVDLGADVVKIEDPTSGDYARWYPPLLHGQSVFFYMNNRGKRSVVLNLKDAEGVAILKKLVESADVLVEGFRPGVMKRLGCDYETLKAINPKLVYCALSGWGSDGPDVDVSGHDLNYVARAGLIGAMKTPQVMGGQFADVGGAYVGVSGIMAALFQRERTGKGAFVDVSLAESALPFMLYNWTEALFLNTERGQGILTGGVACYRVYTTRDAKHVALAALEEKFWANFCKAIARPDLVEFHLKPDMQLYLIKELEGIFSLKTADEWHAQLSNVDCCFCRVAPPSEVANDPHFHQRGALGRLPDGITWMRSPIRLGDSTPEFSTHVPEYGEHTREILRAAGYDEDTLKALAERGVIR